MPALFDHDFGGNREREGVLGACALEVLHIISFSLDYWSIYWHLCSTIALSHVIFRSGWTSVAHLMYPLLSYKVVSPDHVHLLMNMTALMVGILRVEERGNVLLKQLALIAGQKYKSFGLAKDTPKCKGQYDSKPSCVLQSEFWKSSLHCEWLLGMSKQLWYPKSVISSRPNCSHQNAGSWLTYQGYAFIHSILAMGGMMGPQYVELERDLTLLLWLGISMNDNLSQKVYTADCHICQL